MTGPQLAAAHAELVAAELPQETHRRLEVGLMSAMTRKDPGLAFDHFADHIPLSSETGAQLLAAFRKLAEEFPARAEALLDARIADGTFMREAGGAESPARLYYERELLRGLLALRPESAAARIEALPEMQRVEALRGIASRQSEAAYAGLVRRYFSPVERTAEFIRMAEAVRYREGGEAVPHFLDRIAATPEERIAIRAAVPEAGP